MDLLRCLSSQPQAAAQATALSLGAYHTVALMAQNPADPADLQLYAFGRGEPRINEWHNSRIVLQIPWEERATSCLLLQQVCSTIAMQLCGSLTEGTPMQDFMGSWAMQPMATVLSRPSAAAGTGALSWCFFYSDFLTSSIDDGHLQQQVVAMSR